MALDASWRWVLGFVVVCAMAAAVMLTWWRAPAPVEVPTHGDPVTVCIAGHAYLTVDGQTHRLAAPCEER